MPSTSNFIDVATIWLHAGKGGDGAGRKASSFPRFSILLSRTSSRQPRCGWGTWRLASCWYWIW